MNTKYLCHLYVSKKTGLLHFVRFCKIRRRYLSSLENLAQGHPINPVIYQHISHIGCTSNICKAIRRFQGFFERRFHHVVPKKIHFHTLPCPLKRPSLQASFSHRDDRGEGDYSLPPVREGLGERICRHEASQQRSLRAELWNSVHAGSLSLDGRAVS